MAEALGYDECVLDHRPHVVVDIDQGRQAMTGWKRDPQHVVVAVPEDMGQKPDLGLYLGTLQTGEPVGQWLCAPRQLAADSRGHHLIGEHHPHRRQRRGRLGVRGPYERLHEVVQTWTLLARCEGITVARVRHLQEPADHGKEVQRIVCSQGATEPLHERLLGSGLLRLMMRWPSTGMPASARGPRSASSSTAAPVHWTRLETGPAQLKPDETGRSRPGTCKPRSWHPWLR